MKLRSSRAQALRLLFATAVLALSASPAFATSVLYASCAGNTLCIVSPVDGSLVSTVGSTGLTASVTGLAFDPQTGTLYGSVSPLTGPTGGGSLYSFDLVTGVATLVGPFGTGIRIPDIAFNAAGTLFGSSRSSGLVYTIDLSTGAESVFASIGAADTGGNGIELDASGVIQWTRSTTLNAIDGTSGLLLGTLPLTPVVAPAYTLSALTLDPETGTMFALTHMVVGVATLVTLDTSTGVVTTVGPSAGRDAIAFQVPEPTVSVLAVIAAICLIAARRASSGAGDRTISPA